MTTEYARELMSLLNCEKKAAALNEEYLRYLSKKEIVPDNPAKSIRAIRQFLRIEKKWNVDIFGPKTTRWGSTCLETGVAAVLLAGMNGTDARLLFVVNHRPFPLHYSVVFEANGRKVGMEIMFNHNWTPDDRKARYQKALSASQASAHAKYIGIPFKAIGWRRMIKAVRHVRNRVHPATKQLAQPR